MKKVILIVAVLLLAVIVVSGSFFTLREDQYACTFRFSEIVNTSSEAGVHFKVPFVDTVKYFPKETQFYDIPPS